MIHVNLLPGTKKKKAGPAISLKGVQELLGRIKDPWLASVIGVWVVSLAATAGIYLLETRKLEGLEPAVEDARGEVTRFKILDQKRRRAETLRDSVLGELAAIRQIDSDRYMWPHIMEEVTKALPDFTWLVNLRGIPPTAVDDTLASPPVRFRMDGRTSNQRAYTNFVRQLQESPWISSVDARGTGRSTEGEGVEVFVFSVEATYQPADSQYIRVRPLVESLR